VRRIGVYGCPPHRELHLVCCDVRRHVCRVHDLHRACSAQDASPGMRGHFLADNGPRVHRMRGAHKGGARSKAQSYDRIRAIAHATSSSVTETSATACNPSFRRPLCFGATGRCSQSSPSPHSLLVRRTVTSTSQEAFSCSPQNRSPTLPAGTRRVRTELRIPRGRDRCDGVAQLSRFDTLWTRTSVEPPKSRDTTRYISVFKPPCDALTYRAIYYDLHCILDD
jgi:hypothetical protein